jgi:hypothetical protein
MSEQEIRSATIKNALTAAVAGARNDSIAAAADLLGTGAQGQVIGATASTRMFPFIRSTFTE